MGSKLITENEKRKYRVWRFQEKVANSHCEEQESEQTRKMGSKGNLKALMRFVMKNLKVRPSSVSVCLQLHSADWIWAYRGVR